MPAKSKLTRESSCDEILSVPTRVFDPARRNQVNKTLAYLTEARQPEWADPTRQTMSRPSGVQKVGYLWLAQYSCPYSILRRGLEGHRFVFLRPPGCVKTVVSE